MIYKLLLFSTPDWMGPSISGTLYTLNIKEGCKDCCLSGANICNQLRRLSTLVNEESEIKAIFNLVILLMYTCTGYLDGHDLKWMEFLHIFTENLLDKYIFTSLFKRLSGRKDKF